MFAFVIFAMLREAGIEDFLRFVNNDILWGGEVSPVFVQLCDYWGKQIKTIFDFEPFLKSYLSQFSFELNFSSLDHLNFYWNELYVSVLCPLRRNLRHLLPVLLSVSDIAKVFSNPFKF